MHTRLLLFAVLCVAAKNLTAQTEPQFTQYMYNRYLVNPAYTGSEESVEFSLLHRSQYVGLADRFIASQAFNFNMPLYAASSGIGLNVVNDLIGYQRATYVSLAYDYRKKFKWGNMQIGISGGIIQTSLDGSLLRAPDGDYTGGGVNHKDDLLPDNLRQGLSPDFSFGVYFNSEKYFAGASIHHIAFSNASINAAGGTSRLKFARNLFFTGGYNFKLGNKLVITPSALIKSDLVRVQTDVAVNFTIINNILTGISFRGYSGKSVDALALFLGFRYKGLQLVYSYDANLSYLTRFNTGSHEVSLGYRYPLKRKEKRGYVYHNPRFNF